MREITIMVESVTILFLQISQKTCFIKRLAELCFLSINIGNREKKLPNFVLFLSFIGKTKYYFFGFCIYYENPGPLKHILSPVGYWDQFQEFYKKGLMPDQNLSTAYNILPNHIK